MMTLHQDAEARSQDLLEKQRSRRQLMPSRQRMSERRPHVGRLPQGSPSALQRDQLPPNDAADQQARGSEFEEWGTINHSLFE